MHLFRILLFIISIQVGLYPQNITQKELEVLASDKKWLTLLHYDTKTKKSTILSNDFFLSEKGSSQPIEELRATIKAYDQPFLNNANAHPQCRYPARYLWLSKKVHLDNYEKIPKQCKLLNHWELPSKAHSISLVFVSGFLRNPASAFGHSFIKVNDKNDDPTMNDLMDTTISYGAILPKKYSMLSYIFNGITGGYQGKYSNKYYYMDDIVYSNSEFREMWDYELALSSFQKDLILLHFWELTNQKFEYYFFNRNCGYKVSEMIELVQDDKVIENANIWYAPMETFNKVKEINQKRKIIEKIKYIPSAQQQVYAKYKGLTAKEKKLIEKMIIGKFSSIPQEYRHIPTESKIKVIDFLLFFHQYKYPNENEKYTSEAISERQNLMINRLSLPALEYMDTQPKQKVPITESVKTSLIGISGVLNNTNDSFVLRLSPFIIEKLGDNHLDGDHLSILDTEIAFKKGSILLKRLDAVNIRRLKTQEIPFDIDNPFSWSLRFGTEKYIKRDYLVEGGIGYAWKLNEQIKTYAMVNASFHTTEGHYRYRPNVGIYANYGKLRIDASYNIEKDIDNIVDNKYYEVGIQYRIKEVFSLFAKIENRQKNTLEAGLKWHF